MKNHFLKIIFTLLISSVFNACEKEEIISLKFAELEVREVEYREVSIWYSLEDVDKYEVEELGFCYKTINNPTIYDSTFVLYKIEDTIPIHKGNRITIKGLSPNTTYYMKGYYEISGLVYYSKEKTFSTNTLGKPIVSTNTIRDITAASASLGGELLDTNGADIIACGVCWSTSENPTVSGKTTTDSISKSKFDSRLIDLKSSTTYYVQAYATNEVGTSYGEMRTFTTFDGIPELITNNVIVITESTAIGRGRLIDDDGVSILEKGVCWNTKGSPTVNDSKVGDIIEEENFSFQLDNLNPETTYYIRAYAKSEYGIGYGKEISFNSGALVDYDGNTYRWVKIGNQVWMAENLKVTHYPDGTALDYMANGDWYLMYYNGLYYDAYGYHSYNDNSHGAFYIWNVAMGGNTKSSESTPSGIQGICPDGWHLPSDDEWTELENYLIENAYNYDGTTSGNKIGKSLASASGWYEGNSFPCDPGDVGYNQKSNNSTGFSGLPYGNFMDGIHIGKGERDGKWWSSTKKEKSDIYYRSLHLQHPQLVKYYRNRFDGLNVRCVKD